MIIVHPDIGCWIALSQFEIFPLNFNHDYIVGIQVCVPID